MAETEYFGYPPEALEEDGAAGTLALRPGVAFANSRIKVTHEPGGVMARAEAPGGRLIAEGVLTRQPYAELQGPGGQPLGLERCSVGETLVCVLASRALEPGQRYAMSGGRLAGVAGFGPATSVDTSEGAVPIEWLNPGIGIRTRDKGMVHLAWSGSVPSLHLSDPGDPESWPVVVVPDALAGGLPREAVMLAPGHRILVRHPRCELYFGLPEVFVAARDLVGLNGIHQVAPHEGLDFHMVLLPGHEVILAHGLECESFFLDATSLGALDPDARAAMLRVSGPKGGHTQIARPCLDPSEARVLREALVQPALAAQSDLDEARSA